MSKLKFTSASQAFSQSLQEYKKKIT